VGKAISYLELAKLVIFAKQTNEAGSDI